MTPVPVRRHRDVKNDIEGIYDYIAEFNGSAADRFAPAVERTIAGLSELPGKGQLQALR